MVTAKSPDVAQGLIRNWRDPNYLRDWAGFLIAAPFITFEFDEAQDGLSLTDLLWDLSAGAMPSDLEMEKVRAMADRPVQQP